MEIIRAQKLARSDSLYRYTTPLHEFIFRDDPDFYDKIEICYFQNGKLVLQKNKNQLQFEGRKTSFRLSQEETALFKPGIPADIEVRVRTMGGEVPPPARFEIPVTSVLKEVVL